jgi:hypothetical protein
MAGDYSAMRYTKADMLSLVQREFDELDQLVGGLRLGDWERPVPRSESFDPWSVKDALAHIVHWKHLTARRIRGLGRPPDERGLTIPDLNHQVFERWQERPPGDVQAWHREVHADVMAALRARPEDWFTRREHGPDWLSDLHSHSAAHRRRDLEPALIPAARM